MTPDLPTPTTIQDFRRMFPDEEACIEYLYMVRWGGGFRCPKCGDGHAHVLKTRGLVQCKNKHQTSVTAGTTMHRSKQPLWSWFYAAFLISTLKPSISAVQFQDQLGIDRNETAFQMLHKLRSALVDPDREPLKGEVEVDEMFVGGKEEGRPGRGAERKALVICAVEVVRWVEPEKGDPTKGKERRRAGRVRMSVIPDASGTTLLPWLQKHVAPGTVVNTDGWSGYNGAEKLGYTLKRHLQSHKGAKTGVFLPLVHLMISNLKRVLMGTYKGAVRKKHLQAYLNEFVYRFNRRFWRGPAFLRTLHFLVNSEKRPEYETLYDVGEEGGWVHPNPRPPVTDAVVDVLYERLFVEAAPELREWMDAHRDEVGAKIRAAGGA